MPFYSISCSNYNGALRHYYVAMGFNDENLTTEKVLLGISKLPFPNHCKFPHLSDAQEKELEDMWSNGDMTTEVLKDYVSNL